MATDMHRTNIYLSAEDRAIVEYVKQANGLATTSSVVRLALRRLDRQLRTESRRAAGQRQEGE